MSTLTEEAEAADAIEKPVILAQAKVVFRLVIRDGVERVECFVESDEIDEKTPDKPVSFAAGLAAYTFGLFMRGTLIRDAANAAGIVAEGIEISAENWSTISAQG